MKKLTFLLMALLIAGMMTCAAAPAPTGLLDSTPDEAVLASYDDWYAANAKPNDPKIIGKTIFSSPRSVVMLREAGKGTVAGSHFHATADEIVVVLGGSGEIFVNGVWTPVKAGDVHVNPRGVIHATRVTGDQDLKFISVFTPSLPAGGDANFTKEGEKVAIPVGLVDSNPKTAVLVNYDKWYAANAKPDEAKITGQTIFNSPRAIVIVREGGKNLAINHHFHAATDEIVIVLGGYGEMLLNGTWTPVKGGDVHVCPRGIVHSTRVFGDDDIRFISIFTPTLPPGGDTNFIQ